MIEKDVEKWELLGSEYIHRAPWLTARRDHVRLPSGVEMKDYYVLEYPDWVNIIAQTKDGHFLIERQYRHAQQIVGYELPAGCIDEGEDPLHAAQRELLEETGYTGGEWTHFMTTSPNTGSMTNLNYTFLARGVELTDTQHLEKTEDIKVYLMTLEEVKECLLKDEFHQSLMALALWKYFALNKLL